MVDTDILDGITGIAVNGSYLVTPSASISGKLAPGDRIRIDGSHEVSVRRYCLVRPSFRSLVHLHSLLYCIPWMMALFELFRPTKGLLQQRRPTTNRFIESLEQNLSKLRSSIVICRSAPPPL